MPLEFLNSLKVEEQPLLSISEMENNFTSHNNDEKLESTDTNKSPDSNNVKESTDNLLPITDISTDDKLKDKNDSKSDNKNSFTTQSKKYASIIKALHEKTGAFEDFNENDFEDTPESFLKYLETFTYKNAEQMATNYIQNNLSPLQQKFVNLVESGISENDASDLVKGYKLVDGINENTITDDPEKAKKLYAEYLRYTTTFNEEKIKKEVTKREDIGTLVEDALEIIPEFQQLLSQAEDDMKKELQQQEIQRKEFHKRQAKELENYLISTEEIGGIKLTKKIKDNWMKEYGIVQMDDGRHLNPILATREIDPNKFDALLRLYHTIGLFKYDRRKNDFTPDFSVIKNLGKSEAINELHKAVEADNLIRQTGSFIDNDSNFDIEKDDHKKRWSELATKLYKTK